MSSHGTSCTSPIEDAHLVAYWANDLPPDELADIEEHLFACTTCCAAAERIGQIARAFRTSLPPVISPAELAVLRAQGATLVENTFAAGARQTVTFEPGIDLMIHRLGGLDLATAERVEVVVRTESGATGVIFEELFAPFDRERGEVLIACQRHFAAYPHDVVFDVRVHRSSRPPELATYFIPHEFP